MTIDPKRTGVKAFMVPEYKEGLDPGACVHHPEDERLSFACPGCGQWGGIRGTHPKQANSWDITSGSLTDATTLTVSPSIHCIGCCGWHGYLINGVFQSC